MSEIKKYTDIVRLGHKSTIGVLNKGDYITITEKVDGANASFILNKNGKIDCFSRRTIVSKGNTLRGFYNWVTENIKPNLLNPKYRYFGEWLCLSGDTEIRLLSGGKRGHIMNLRDMYKYSTEKIMEKSNFKKKDGSYSYSEREPWWKRHSYPKIFSLFIDEDIIKPQKIKKIIYSGEKEVYKVTTREGKEIKSTLEHLFFTNEGWKSLKEINIGDVVATSDLFNHREPRKYGKGTLEIRKVFNELKNKINCEECGINNSLEIHHKDFNWRNNNLNNLQVLCKECHSKKQKNITMANVKYNYIFDKIINIEFVGVEDCYDISMDADENSSSFVANGFIVHNCSHKVQYKQEYYNNFYLFNIYDEEKQEYLSDDIMRKEAGKLNIKTVPLFYEGEYISFEHLMSFVGKTNMALNYGEGVVVKNVNYKNKYGKQIFVKLVHENFIEIQKQKKPKNPNKPITVEQEFVNMCLTKARVDKILHKLIDEGILEENFGIEDMGIILKNIGNRIYEDIIKEEIDFLPKSYEIQLIKKAISYKLPQIVKEIIKEH